MASVEDLIDELFSDEEIKSTLRKSSDNSQSFRQLNKSSSNAKRKMHDWDDEVNGGVNKALRPVAQYLPSLPSRHEFDEVDKNNSNKMNISDKINSFEAMRTNNNVHVNKANDEPLSVDNKERRNVVNFDSDSECEGEEQRSASHCVKNTENTEKDYRETFNNNNNIRKHCKPASTLHTSHWDSEEQFEQTEEQTLMNGKKLNGSKSKESSDKYAVLFTVPFPPAPPPEVGANAKCVNRCYVTCLPGVFFKKHGHPTVPQLRALLNTTRATYAQQSDKERLIERGAFYAVYPRWGNGCSDKSLMDGNEYGGCPFMLCLRCNYGVIRLQDAEWCDDSGSVDLYLTTRNYYPDWSRLASTSAIGVEQEHTDSESRRCNNCSANEQKEKYVLRSSVHCAAYCCQCSWLTVKSERCCIETKLTDAIAYKYDDAHLSHNKCSVFATVLPLPVGERRRPPLWVCRGHIAAV